MNIDRATVTLIVVTYNSKALLRDFVGALPEALRGVKDVEVIVVDNASTDGSAAEAESYAMVDEVFRLDQNRGYAAGINAGIRHRPDRDAYFVLNPDVRLWPGCVTHLLASLQNSQAAGIVVPALFSEHGEQLHSLRREPSLLRALGEALLGGYRAGRWPALGEIVMDDATYGQVGTADWATGGAMMIAGSCIAQVGLWDESFFLYEEEVEFALRARDCGFGLIYVPEAKATRLIGGEPSDSRFWPLIKINKVRLYARRHGRLLAVLYRGVVMLGEAIRAGAGRPESRRALKALLQPYPAEPMLLARMDQR
jgi:N-acetylglucosaminyl-diphospho-decaprenol L-rhamnosyltransferase